MSGRILVPLLVFCLMACSIGGSTLQEWSEAKEGEKRLSAFLADSDRELRLRLDALDFLIQGGHYTSIMGVFAEMDKAEQKYWVQSTWYKIAHRLEKQKFTTVDRIEAASLAYYLLQYREHLDGYANQGEPHQKPFAEFAVVNLVTWALETIKTEEDVPQGTKKLSEVIFAAAVAHPEGVLPQFDGFLSTMPEYEDFLLVTDILARLKTQEAHQLEAKSLLQLARKNYPKITPELGERMFKNRNETLLRFLLDAALDVRVNPKVRIFGLKSAEVLKEKATLGLLSLLRVEEPEKDNFMRTQALEKLWLYAGGEKVLATALSALPTEGTYWPEGTKFRDQVGLFCEKTLGASATDVKETLVDLTTSNNFIAQIYAAECIIRLYPSEAKTLLQDLLDEDLDEEIAGWDASGPISFGEYLENTLP